MFETVPEFRPFGGTGRRDRAFDILLHCCFIPLVMFMLPIMVVMAWVSHVYTSTRKLFLRTIIDVAEASGSETGIRTSLDTSQEQLLRYAIREESRSLTKETFNIDLAFALVANALAFTAFRRVRQYIKMHRNR